MEKRRVGDAPALTGAVKKLKPDSSQMLKTLHDSLDMVVEEVELKENQLQALTLKLAEIQKQMEQQTDKLKAIEDEARDKEKALGLIRNLIKSEEKTLTELRTSLENTGNELELKKAELKKTGTKLEMKKRELKKTELRLRSSVLVKQEPQPIAAEPELTTRGALQLYELSSAPLNRHETKVGLITRVSSEELGPVLEELPGIGGLEKPELQHKAKELASVWKENITIEAPRSSLEALAFLLFIVTLGLKSLINEEETILLASSVFHYTQEFVRDLIKDHQYIPAVRIICLLKLKDFSATTLLMKEITDLRRSAMGKVKNRDVGRLRAIVELVADYKLDIDLPGELIAKIMLLRENSAPPELHCSVEVDEATCSGVDLLVPKHETKPLVNPSTNCSC